MPATVVCYSPPDKSGFRIVTGSAAFPSPCVELKTGSDALDVPIWQVVNERSSQEILWRAVQALRDHIVTDHK